jgi:hypothetical protein
MFSAQQAWPPLKRRSPPEAPPAVVRVEIGDEAAVLRKALVRQQSTLGDLQVELDVERGAMVSVASEAMQGWPWGGATAPGLRKFRGPG